ncbi:hypothetical protein M8818_005366 [Zalaria obscura]|uniref:Uncharacterized protein n=1 Tax=Zalaria obscura TaxID=2024903 RepID=A0ACC3S951_9PEZI
MIDIEQLLDLEVPGAVRISPSGKKVVYTTSLSLGHRKGENATSSIWIADVGKKHSARQLTSGLYNDKSPRWSPDSESIAFISDRAKAGKSSALYSLSLQGGEPVALTNADNERPIGTFAWSPDGKWIAFTSADEKSAEKKKREEEKDDVQVYGEEWDFNRLRLLHASTKTVTTLYGKDRHALDLTWNESGSSIAFMTQKTPELESGWVDGLDLQQASPVTKEASKICDLPGLSLSQWRGTGLHWTGDRIYYIATVDPKYVTGSDALCHCIEAGLTDPKRIVAGGWSQGGFLSYLASTRNGAHGQGWKFRGTICGAGVTDWDMMAMSSDVPSFESEMGQSPWRGAASFCGEEAFGRYVSEGQAIRGYALVLNSDG